MNELAVPATVSRCKGLRIQESQIPKMRPEQKKPVQINLASLFSPHEFVAIYVILSPTRTPTQRITKEAGVAELRQ